MKNFARIIATLLGLAAVDAGARPLAIVGGTIIDGNGGPVVRNGVIVVDGDRIVSVGSKDTAIPTQSGIIQASGKYIIPGLMDANVHLLIDTRLENVVRFEGRYPELVIEAAQIALKNGVTTVFDSWGPLPPLAEARRRINQGEAQGSRLYFAGNIVGFDGPFSQDFSSAAAKVASKNLADRINGMWEQGVGRRLLWMSADQVRAEMRAYLAKGVDFVKYGVNAHTYGEKQFILFSDAAQRAIVEETHRAGITVQTHTYSVESVRMAIDAGVELMQHCDLTGPVPMPEALMRAMIEKHIACAALANTNHRLAHFREMAADPQIGEHFGVAYPVADDNIRRMVKLGVPIVMATDAGLMHPDAASDAFWKRFLGDRKEVLTELGTGHFAWLRAMEEKQMAPMTLLMAATRDVARAYRLDRNLGTLERGKIADLLVLDRNPLEGAANYNSISRVMKAGVFIDRHALPTQRLLTAVVQ